MYWHLIFLFVSMGATAPLAFSGEIPTKETICKILHQELGLENQSKMKQMELEILKLKFFPSRYSKPQIIEYNYENSLTAKPLETSKPEDSGNYIFVMGTPPYLESEIPQAEKELDQIKNKIRAEVKKFLQLTKAEGEIPCLKIQKELQFDPENLRQLQEQVQRLEVYEQTKQGEALIKHLKAAKLYLHLNWKVVVGTDMNELARSLQHLHMRNLVIVTHATSAGEIVDSFGNLYPHRFFETISPSLYSLAIFSCFSEKVRKLYSLDQIFEKRSSQFKQSMVAFVQEATTTLPEHVAPLDGFSSFLLKIDRYLTRHQSEWRKSQYQVLQSPRQCQYSLQGPQVRLGSYGVLLNNHFLGLIHRGENRATSIAPCSFLSKEQNVVIVRDFTLLQNSEIIQSSEEDLEFKVNGRVVAARTENYYFSDKKYRSSKIILTLN